MVEDIDSRWSVTKGSQIRTAREFAAGIREHWGIENRLHWGVYSNSI